MSCEGSKADAHGESAWNPVQPAACWCHHRNHVAKAIPGKNVKEIWLNLGSNFGCIKGRNRHICHKNNAPAVIIPRMLIEQSPTIAIIAKIRRPPQNASTARRKKNASGMSGPTKTLCPASTGSAHTRTTNAAAQQGWPPNRSPKRKSKSTIPAKKGNMAQWLSAKDFPNSVQTTAI